MSVVGRILAAYRAPARQMRAQIDDGIAEPETLFYALLAGAANLLAQTPSLYKRALIDADISFADLFGAQFVASIFFMPLAMFAISAVFHMLFRLFGGRASWPAARRSFIWPVLVASPFVMVTGIVTALSSNPLVGYGFVLLTLVVFIWQWYMAANEAEYNEPKSVDAK